MPGHSRSNNGVASLAYLPGIHVLAAMAVLKDVDGRDKPDGALALLDPCLAHSLTMHARSRRLARYRGRDRVFPG